MKDVKELIEKMMAGDQRSLARLISVVERESNQTSLVMEAVSPYTGNAFRIGVTGPPGSGKSTVVGKIASIARGKGLSVGIIAVDPSSPFSGGALLGDRIRMDQNFLDEDVFIRSMATRGSLGGLPRTASAVMKLLDAFGKNFIIVETVGVGQAELDVMQNVDATVVILVPESGDTIQIMKAGLMEIANVFAVNKSDRPGADNLVTQLEMMLEMKHELDGWQIPVIPTQAVNNIGIRDLYEQIERYREVQEQNGSLVLKRQKQRKTELLQIIERSIMTRITKLIESDVQLVSYLKKVERGDTDPYSAARDILGNRILLETWFRQVQQV